MKTLTTFTFLILIFTGISAQTHKVSVGADLLISENFELIKQKNIGLVTNHTGRLSDGTHLIQKLLETDSTNLKALFGPEHGILGNAPDGNSITDSTLEASNIPIYSLYGKIRKPTEEMMKDIDVLIFDIQDVGTRFYTYISTMYYCIEAAADNNIPIIILDRPNPIGAILVEGPVTEPGRESFVGIAPIPIVHGMTIGELALLFSKEKMINSGNDANVIVIKMKNWQREYYYEDCGINWIKPSPNMPDIETAKIYPGMCLIEGTNISEGRGTFKPFLQIGAPFINGENLAAELNKLDIEGIKILPTEYTPISIDTMSTSPKYLDQLCSGVSFEITSKNFNALRFGIVLISIIHNLYPDEFKFRSASIDRLYGSDKFRLAVENGESPEVIFNSWEKDLANFKNLRRKYLLY